MLKPFILMLTFKSILNILIGVDGTHKLHCLSKHIDVSDMIHLNYLVTGEEDADTTSVKLFNPNNIVIFEHNNKHDGELIQEVKDTGYHRLCFYPQSDKPHFISFEYFTQYERGHTLNMAKDRKK